MQYGSISVGIWFFIGMLEMLQCILENFDVLFWFNKAVVYHVVFELCF